jgi:hypothetical protein
VDPRRAGKTRRWQPGVAVVAALALFTALIAGSALRSQFSAAALPEPAAWSHAAAHVEKLRLHGSPQVTSRSAGCLCGTAPASKPVNKPVNKKPFHSMWMTQDRPQTWTRWAPQSARSAPRASFAPSVFAAGGARSRSPAYLLDGQDLLNRLCVTRC